MISGFPFSRELIVDSYSKRKKLGWILNTLTGLFSNSQFHTNLKIFLKQPRDFNGRDDRLFSRQTVSKKYTTVLNNGCLKPFIVKREAGGAESSHVTRSPGQGSAQHDASAKIQHQMSLRR